MDEFAVGESFGRLKNLLRRRQVKEIVGVVADVLRGGNHKAEGAASRIVAQFARLWFHEPNDNINKDARREVLPRARFFFVAFFSRSPS